MRQLRMRDLLPGVIAVLFVGLPLSLLYFSPDAQATLRGALATLSPQTVSLLSVILVNAVLFGMVVIGFWSFRDVTSKTAFIPNSQITVRLGKYPVQIEAASVCDQVYLAVSKIPGVQVIEVSTMGQAGRAHVEIKAMVDTLNLLTPKAEAIRAAIKALAAEQLHITLADEPTLIMRIKPIKAKADPKPRPPKFGSMPKPSTGKPGLFSRFGMNAEPPPSKPHSTLFGPNTNPPTLAGGGLFGRSGVDPDDPARFPKPPEKPADRPSTGFFGFRKPDDPPLPRPNPFSPTAPNSGDSGLPLRPTDDEPPSAFKDFLDDLFDGEPDDDPDDRPNMPKLPF